MTETRVARLSQILFEIGKAIGSDDDLSSLLGHVSELVCQLVPANACSVMLLDSARQRLLTRASHGLRDTDLQEVSFAVGEGLCGWVATNGRHALVGDVETDPRFIHRRNRTVIGSIISVPLTARGEIVGVLNATAPDRHAFSASDLDVLSFVAKTIALDIENKRLRRVSVTDPLTGAYNREFLQERLPAELSASIDRNLPLSVAMIDVDHFKRINDELGHDTGDRVLQEVAGRLRSSIRSDDLLVRYGGEEFLVMLPNADLARACEVGERMRAELPATPIWIPEDRSSRSVRALVDEDGHADPVAAPASDPPARSRSGDATGHGNRGGDEQGVAVNVFISVGVAELRPSEAAEVLIHRADTALYTAKRKGRNRVEAAP